MKNCIKVYRYFLVCTDTNFRGVLCTVLCTFTFMSKSNACFVLTISPFQHANKSSIVNCILIKKSICFSKVTFQLIWIPLCLYYFEYALINRIWMFLMKITKKRVLKFKPSKNVKYTKCKDTNNECGIKLLQVTLSSQYLKNPWTWKSCRKLILSVFTKIQSNVTKWDESFFLRFMM